jgi:hypothetical protein
MAYTDFGVTVLSLTRLQGLYAGVSAPLVGVTPMCKLST